MTISRALLLTLLFACDGGKTDTDSTDSTGGDTDDSTITDTPDTDDSEVEEPEDWTFRSHPCVGNRTDTFTIASDGSWWVGCGTTTTGRGLFTSSDEGRSWTSPTTEPANYFDDYRVIDIWEDGGRIYASGDNTTSGDLGKDGVVSFDLNASPAAVMTEFASGNQFWNSFLVGTYRQNSAGFAVTESNNGTGVVYRTGPSEPWLDGSDWGNPTVQILDLQVHDDQFYGVGSTIADSPYVFLPPPAGELPTSLQLTKVALSTNYTGEMWSLHVGDDGIFVGGVDQDGAVGKAYFSGSDPYDASTWTEVSLDDYYPGMATWVEGVCRNGDTMVIVGRISNLDDAVVLRSIDAGATWIDIRPVAGSMYRCHVLDDTRIVTAGKDGEIGVWDVR